MFSNWSRAYRTEYVSCTARKSAQYHVWLNKPNCVTKNSQRCNPANSPILQSCRNDQHTIWYKCLTVIESDRSNSDAALRILLVDEVELLELGMFGYIGTPLFLLGVGVLCLFLIAVSSDSFPPLSFPLVYIEVISLYWRQTWRTSPACVTKSCSASSCATKLV